MGGEWSRARGSSGCAVVVGCALSFGCAGGTGNDGSFGSASIGEGEGTATEPTAEGPGDASAEDSAEATGPSGSGPDDTNPSDSDPAASDTMDTAGGEVCNGLDDDGDGTIDDGIPDIECGLGACAATVVGCDGGVPSQCFPGTPTDEQCNGLDDDCDGSADEDLTQACDSSCGAGTQSCNAGSWGECDAPPPSAETCNVADDDCNGQIDEGVGGCRIEVHRWYHPVTGEHFYSTDANEGLCCGFDLEFQDYFALYAGQQGQTTAFYRCYQPGGFHHYTTDANCEGLQVNEGVMGYIGTVELPGSTALYRSYYAAIGDHFFTTSLDEHNFVVGTYGFIDEGTVGWVW